MQAERLRRLPGARRVAALAVALAGAIAAFPAPAPADPGDNIFDTIGITRLDTRAASQIRGGYSYKGEEMPLSKIVVVPPDDDTDNVPLRMPDTTGNVPNLAKFLGQRVDLFEADQKAYTRVHFFGTTTDGGPAGGSFVLTYDDGSTQAIDVRFIDWCQTQNTPARHTAIGPLSGRWTSSGQDTAPCSIFHVPAEIDESKTVVAVTLPPATAGGGANTQSYLMSLTLEQPDGAFEMIDLSGSLQFPDDDIAPVTTHVLEPGAPDGADGWYRSPVRVTFDSTDEGGSGVEQILYRINGGAPQSYGGPFELQDTGELTLEYRAIDGAGNAEGYRSVALKADPVAPHTTARLGPPLPQGTEGWYDGPVTVTLNASDDTGSGLTGTSWRIDGGPWQPYTAPVVVEEAGLRLFEYRSDDAAGNTETPGAALIKVDRTAPTTTALVDGAAPRPSHAGPARVSFVRTDGDGSGATATEYRIGDGAWTPYAGAFDLTALGTHRVDFRSRDLVGNVENYRTLWLELTAPSSGSGEPPTAPAPRPFAALAPVAARHATLAALRGGRLAVPISCQGVRSGRLTLSVTRATARRLGLPGTVLAARSVRCGSEGRATVRLRAGADVRRALKGQRGRVQATLRLAMRGAAGDTARVVLRGGGRRGG